MVRLRYLWIIGCLLLIACSGKAPKVQDINGHAIDMSQLKGKWVVVNYWADWCGACRQEIPELNHLYHSHRNRLVVLGVNFDAKANHELRQLAERLDIHYPVLKQFPIQQSYGGSEIRGLPTTFLINPEGELVKTVLGPHDRIEFEKLMELRNG